MSVMLPDFAPRIDRTQFNRYLQSYRRWAYDQRQRGAPVTCWCLYLWLAGNRRDQNSAILRTIRKPMQRPAGSTSNEWQGWKQCCRKNGSLSFSEYLARRAILANKGQGMRTDLYGPPKPKENRPKVERKNPKKAPRNPYKVPKRVSLCETPPKFPVVRKNASKPKPPTFAKQPFVPKDGGLRMEPSAVVAKINRLLAAQGIGRR